MTEAKKPAAEPAAEPAATKSATDLLIEMQLEEQRRKSINPLAITDEVPVEGEKTEDGVSIITRRVFADGAVLESLA